MQVSVEMLLGIYGAVVSTGLAALETFKFLRERPRISVDAQLITQPAREGQDTHGVLLQVKLGRDEVVVWVEKDIGINIRTGYP